MHVASVLHRTDHTTNKQVLLKIKLDSKIHALALR
jgi:hypothetical protein